MIVAESGSMTVHSALGHYPNTTETQRLVRVADPDVAFIDLAHPDEALDFLHEVRVRWPRAALVGIDPPANVNLDAIGIGGYIGLPPEGFELEEAVSRAVRRASGAECPNLWTFLPAKAGCGCSTVVVQTGLELARQGKKVLVLESDLRSGVMSLMLRAPSVGTMQNALQAMHHQESHRLAQNITQVHGVDFLLSNRTRMDRLPDWSDFHELLELLAPQYDFVLADLPELVNEATAEVVLRSHGVYLVTTQELLALELAPRRLAELAACGVSDDKVKVLVNRFHRQELSQSEVETHLGRPVACQLPNDYVAVRRAVMAGAAVDKDSALGRGFKQLANILANNGDPVSAGSGWGTLLGKLRRAG